MFINTAIKRTFNVLGFEIARRGNLSVDPFAWLRRQNVKTVLDIGANVGEWTLRIHQEIPAARMYCFEPLAKCYQRLLHNLRRIPNACAFKVAFDDHNGESFIWSNRYAASSSLLPMGDLHKRIYPHSRNAVRESVAVRRLDDMATELELADDVMIKIDVQGYEDRVILGGRQVISRARIVLVETAFEPLYEGQALFGDIYDLLTSLGFAYAGNFQQSHNPETGTVLQETDSVFVRRTP